VVDIGAGAGAPGVPLAILNPELHVTRVEPRRRRVAFMRTAVGQLRLAERVRVIEGRHDVAPGPFDFAYSRATFAPPEWLTIGAVMAPRVGVLLAAGDAPVKAGWQVTQERAYTTVAASRRLLVFKPE
ncbi:MAG: RsmG family class I SAM-dependent methyltransferase, partial [Myxococcota bacterium]